MLSRRITRSQSVNVQSSTLNTNRRTSAQTAQDERNISKTCRMTELQAHTKRVSKQATRGFCKLQGRVKLQVPQFKTARITRAQSKLQTIMEPQVQETARAAQPTPTPVPSSASPIPQHNENMSTAYKFIPVPPEAFPDPSAHARLAALRQKELTCKLPPPIRAQQDRHLVFKFDDYLEKWRIIRSLHDHIFIVKDELGYPLKIDMPTSSYDKEVGVEHIFNAHEWSDIEKPADSLVETDIWPPKSMADLLTACSTKEDEEDEEEECVGCLRRLQHYSDEKLLLYAMSLQQNDAVNFKTPDGREVGYAVANSLVKETVHVELYPSQEVVETEWRNLYVNPKFTASEKIEKGLLDAEKKMQEGGRCGCRIERWRKWLGEWHKRVELKKIGDEGVGVFAMNSIPQGRPIGEIIGKLKPHLGGDEEDGRITLSIGKEVKQNEGSGKVLSCWIDNSAYGNFTRFVRESKEANSEMRECRCGNLRMAVLFSTKVFAKDEEVMVRSGPD